MPMHHDMAPDIGGWLYEIGGLALSLPPGRRLSLTRGALQES